MLCFFHFNFNENGDDFNIKNFAFEKYMSKYYGDISNSYQEINEMDFHMLKLHFCMIIHILNHYKFELINVFELVDQPLSLPPPPPPQQPQQLSIKRQYNIPLNFTALNKIYHKRHDLLLSSENSASKRRKKTPTMIIMKKLAIMTLRFMKYNFIKSLEFFIK